MNLAPQDLSPILLLAFVGDSGEFYAAWARDYYEVEIDPASVASVFGREPLTPRLVTTLNPGREMDTVLADAAEIGYPVG